MLTKLYDNNDNISPQDLSENYARLKATYDVSQPIESFFDQVEDAMELAAAGNTPYTPGKIVNIALNLIFKKGKFADNWKLWKRLPEVEKSWSKFKIHFYLAHKEMSETKQHQQNQDLERKMNPTSKKKPRP